MLSSTSLERLEDGWEERSPSRCCGWDPSTALIDLVRDEAAMAWRVPDGLATGPWWVLGWDGDRRFRPLLKMVQGEQSPLKSAS